MAAAAADGDAPIAAFAVAKGGVVLKHIFLNAPPPEAATTRGRGAEDSEDEEEDPPVMVGRHPDCHVLVDHPSVSRFHLELRCRRRQRLITVTDLCSGETAGRTVSFFSPLCSLRIWVQTLSPIEISYRIILVSQSSDFD
jgi:pSer/pThr/pTyr-binding forkhead associated (FHA) protein